MNHYAKIRICIMHCFEDIDEKNKIVIFSFVNI